MAIFRIDDAAEDILNDLRDKTGKSKKQLLSEALVYYKVLLQETRDPETVVTINRPNGTRKQIVMVTKLND